MKTCAKCKEAKPVTAFAKDAQTKDGLRYWCRACKREWYKANKERERARDAAYRAAHRKESRARATKRNRRTWAPGEHERAEAALPYVSCCAICGAVEPRGKGVWHADHDPKTGLFRGHLCNNCNVGLGYFDDDPLVLRKALEYLLDYQHEDASLWRLAGDI